MFQQRTVNTWVALTWYAIKNDCQSFLQSKGEKLRSLLPMCNVRNMSAFLPLKTTYSITLKQSQSESGLVNNCEYVAHSLSNKWVIQLVVFLVALCFIMFGFFCTTTGELVLYLQLSFHPQLLKGHYLLCELFLNLTMYHKANKIVIFCCSPIINSETRGNPAKLELS